MCAPSARTPRTHVTRSLVSFDNTGDVDGSPLALDNVMASPTMNVERLWAMPDGTICLLVEREDAPRFEICVVRGEEVLRQNRLYARGSAHMLAETWRSNLSPAAPLHAAIAC
jgi:hypothetical protein